MTIQSRFKVFASCLSVAGVLSLTVSSRADTFNWSGAGDAQSLFGGDPSTAGYWGNWSPNLGDPFPGLADFVIDALSTGVNGSTLSLAEGRTIKSLAFTGTFTGTSINGAIDAVTSVPLTFGTPGGTILSMTGNSGASGVTFAATAPIALNYTGFGTVDTAAGSVLTINSVVSGTGGLTKIGAGTLALTPTNTYTGGLQIFGGVVQVGAAGNLGALPAAVKADAVVINGGTLRFSGTGTATASGVNRGFQVGASVGTIEVTGSLSRTITGVIGDYNGEVGILRKTGTGTLVLNSAGNRFSGGLEILEGTISTSGTLTLGLQAGVGTTINGGTLQFTNTSGVYSVSDRKFFVGSNVGTISVDTSAYRMRGPLTDVAGQAGVLRKIGAGTLILDATMSHTGGTQVNAGTLILAGSTRTLGGATSVTGLTVAAGATFAGAGTVSGASVFNAGSNLKVDAYNSANSGAFSVESNVTSLTFSGGLNIAGLAASDLHSLYFDLGATTASDKITVAAGTFAIGSNQLGMTDFTFTAQTGFDVGTYTLFTSQSLVGTLLSSDTTGTLNGFNTVLQIVGNELQLVVSASAVPEPATWAAIFGGAALSIAVIRRRKTSAV